MENQVVKNPTNQKSKSNVCQQVFSSNNLSINYNTQFLDQSKVKQKIQVQEEDFKFNFSFSQYPNSSNDFDEFSQQNKVSDSNQIEILFELLQGEYELSNVIKVTVRDHGRMSLNQMLKMFQILNTKNIDFSSEYQNNNFLGWKINYHIIGNLGPFYNFFIKSQENQFTEYSHRSLYYKSQPFYQQNLNQNKLKSQINKQNTERLIQNSTYNSELIYKFMKDKAKIKNNLQNSKSSQNI
ncbi:hypothetical protein TTHERM_00483440 (macronuclear) [Tetrahymena thermophila SB210]|uniref:Uncharacterized protein n=1 Tax=Tetrahymena thermophila (strain SB210) TaxID=312017 RepID=I7M857_TETTS|nr:hypothetical protein TTHERM_00483440 [Tetrahymena thermophila SB210]EAR97212.1 hypothetical protein TTHERM_00483440 [Tetrahymena thermophila SB210]|eukprot:XP_001017457.1 hypothetical protein TTHERM_00483440 [Tetrahymena thermophila SB210]